MRTVKGFAFTKEQDDVVDTSVIDRNSVLVASAAGASKSTTSLQVAREFRGVTQYTVFGSRNTKEWAASANGCAKVASNYGLAHREIGHKYRSAGRIAETNKHLINAIVDKLGKKNLKPQEIEGYNIDTNTQAYDIFRMITMYCYSVDTEIGLQHGVCDFLYPDETIEIKERLETAYYTYLLQRANYIWKLMLDPNGSFPISHDVYAKLWSLFGTVGNLSNGNYSSPRIACDLLISDETQDINPVFAEVFRNQDCQKLILGDNFQSIFQWRKSINAMDKFDIERKLQLSKSFRFGEDIGRVAADIIKFQLDEDIDIKGFEKINTVVHTSPAHFRTKTILCRTNAECVRHLVDNQGSYNVKIIGDMSGMVKNIKGILALRAKSKDSKKVVYGPLSVFKDYKDLMEYAKTSAGGEIMTLIQVMNKAQKMGIDAIKLCDILQKSAKTRNPDITVSTAHKAKGLEWDNVVLSNDMRRPCDEGWTPEDANLLYVAATRGMKNLDISGCAAALEAVELDFDHLLEKKK